MKKIKKRLINMVKYSSILYRIYRFFFQSFINILKLFIRNIDDKLILFVVYGGKRYDDSPRFIYEYLKKNKGNKYKYVWAFIDPDKFPEVPEEEKIKIDTVKYYKIALKAKYWITNSSITRGLNLKRKGTKNIFFTHGMTGIKKIGQALTDQKGFFKKRKENSYDMIMLEGKKELELVTKAFGYEEDKFFNLGLPRNDELAKVDKNKVIEIKKKLKIPLDKKVILYAPTFREFYKDAQFNRVIDPPFDFKKMEEELGKEYVFLFTAHYEVAKILKFPKDIKFVINAFEYPYINDLLMVADILISDYSSVFFDYSILERPMLCYGYDYDLYEEKRGFYTDLNKLFSHGVIKTQEELIDIIKNMDYKKECKFTKGIKEEYISNYGDATEKCTKEIFKE